MGNQWRGGKIALDPPIRWSLMKASTELGMSEEKIKMGLKKHGIMPGDDQKWSTQQICKAAFDPDAHGTAQQEAKTQKMVAEAEKAQQDLLELRLQLVRTSTLDECLAEIFQQIVQLLRHLPLPSEERERLLKIVNDNAFDSTKFTGPEAKAA